MIPTGKPLGYDTPPAIPSGTSDRDSKDCCMYVHQRRPHLLTEMNHTYIQREHIGFDAIDQWMVLQGHGRKALE